MFQLRWVRYGLPLMCCLLLAVVTPASDMGMAAADQVSLEIYRDFLDLYLYTHDGDNRGFGAEHNLARDNIVSLFASYGLSVTLEPVVYSGQTYYNVVGTKTGVAFPDVEYIIGAHYDSVNNPGADDNASGTALVLECARILSQYDSDCTIRFVAFTREEQGLYGSQAYVDDHLADDIRGMISADMVAYDTNTNHALIYGRSASAPIKNALAAAINEYGDGLTCADSGSIDASDHAPFEWAGFQACLLIEGQVWSNPNYHTQDDSFDTPNYLDFEYAVRNVRSTVGYLVDNAGVFVWVDGLDFTYPNGQPDYIGTLGTTRVRVEVAGIGNGVPVPGTGLLHYDVGNGWETAPLEVVADNVYDAVLPAATCGASVNYYVSADSVAHGTFTDPGNAPTRYFSAIAANGELDDFADNFQTDMGWTVQNESLTAGAWQRGIPAGDGSRGDPTQDYDGSGRCYLTGNAAGDSDVDGGPTRLISPRLDLTALNEPYISYARWFYNDDNNDRMVVQVSNNDGSSWTTVEDLGPFGGWQVASFRVADFVTPTAQVRVRFNVADQPNDSVTEAGVDAFRVFAFDCDEFGFGDLNCDGTFDGADIDPFFLALGYPDDYANQFPGCNRLLGDMNLDGALDGADIDPFFECLAGGNCP